MAIFEYRIYKEVYEDIISKKKNVEYRLLNEKSNKIKKGDKILFKVLDCDDILKVTVTNTYIYNNIDELYENIKNLSNTLNYTKNEFTELFYKIFSKEKVINSKIIGIEFKL